MKCSKLCPCLFQKFLAVFLKGFFLLLLPLFLSVQILFSAFPFQCRLCFEGSFACYFLRVYKIQTIAVLQILLWPYCIHLPIRMCKTLSFTQTGHTFRECLLSVWGSPLLKAYCFPSIFANRC